MSKRIETAIFTNMCMIYDENGNVLVQDRVGSNWAGITFPGGHVESGESFTDAAIREVYEETGLTVSKLQLCGIQDFFLDDGTRYCVYFYKTNCFSGDLRSSVEGDVFWTSLSKLHELKLSNGMDSILKLYGDNTISEQFFYKENGKYVEELK
ncbi:MAG: 8-oxo-dGTP diphosphatase [Ruminococcaceae bacterium]|nr:8-oxo-dGTP diphosphatase [Oscillospiraceae bacterium]